MLTAIRAETMFDGLSDHPLSNRIVVIKDCRIDGIETGDPDLPADTRWLEAPVLAPGFLDLQINGAADVLFNDLPTVEGIAKIATGAGRGGAAYLLPTFITAAGQSYGRALEAVSAAIDQDVPGVLGLHLEGPFLSPKRPGIHDAAAIRPIEISDLDYLCDHRSGVRLITLAPEEQPTGAIERLCEAGWIIFAGHSEASFDVMRGAAAAGLRGVTHLFNAMSQITPREPGLVGSVFDDDRLVAGIIADGIHVHPANLRLAVDRLGKERLCLVTDAMPTLGGKRLSFELAGKTIRLEGGQLSDVEGRLAGAHLSMAEAVRNLVSLTGVNLAAALEMASATPARTLGLGAELGRIERGYRAGLTVLSDDLHCLGVMTDGHWRPSNED
jgi:N-acetylglucosamine-6-phosphate deacetylase